MTDPTPSPYDAPFLARRPANHQPLTPLSLLDWVADTYPGKPSMISGARRFTWAEMRARCRRLASALRARGIGLRDTVSVMGFNTTELYEAHFGVPMAGAVMNALNIRLDPATIAFILEHAEAKLLIADRAFGPVVKAALSHMATPPPVIDIADPDDPNPPIAEMTYEDLLATGDPDFAWAMPADEWDPITLNYTSGTTGNPKGVVYSHRGAYLNAMAELVVWQMPNFARYLWTLPMFHCNGWCFPWAMPAVCGVNIGLRRIDAKAIYDAIADHGVTHLCGAPIIMDMIITAGPDARRPFDQPVKMMTAAAPPPAATLQAMADQGITVTHVYGLTEVYGPATVCAWDPDWDGQSAEARAGILSRQGVRYPTQERLMVANPETLEPVPADGATIGEVMMRGNNTMKGYLKNPDATEKAFAGGWFRTGDLGVVYPDGYIQLKDRSKDIIISGGENISSIEIEDALFKLPEVAACAVVAKPDPKWGETPCAFIELRDGKTLTEDQVIAHCRATLAGYKIPRAVVFGPIPKTSTGKVQKFVLRDRAGAG